MEKKTYNTTLDVKLLKNLKILATETGKRQNELIEEALKDLLLKYGKYEETPGSRHRPGPQHGTGNEIKKGGLISENGGGGCTTAHITYRYYS